VVAELAAAAVLILATGAESLHAARIRRLAPLAFGPGRRPRDWARAAPFLRVLAFAGAAWGLATLAMLPPKIHRAGEARREDPRHVLLVLDVSPSMTLKDAGPEGVQSRKQRAADLLDSFVGRIRVEDVLWTVVAVYNGAKPVFVDGRDVGVVRNVLADLPLHQAFEAGKTKLFDGLREAARIAAPWKPASATLILVSDGDSVPDTGMPAFPPSISETLVLGVGDPRTGKFIDGKMSRQDAPTLRQIAARLGGTYHDGNTKHVPTDVVRGMMGLGSEEELPRLTKREYALLAAGLGALVLASLPALLARWGTGWRPGVRTAEVAT
jgi:Ca-activated chloride channel family protein